MIEELKSKQEYKINDLLEIMQILRMPGGCPWDAEQTHESIKKNLIEEVYEVIEAINKNDKDLLKEELGDLLLQIVFHTQMEAENGTFDFDDVADGICRKLIERHPHVFGEVVVNNVDDVLNNWDTIKRNSKGQKKSSTAMESVPRELPALMRSEKIQQKAKKSGFDWKDVNGPLEKLDEEIAELKESVAIRDEENIIEELGDVLFSVVNVSRHLNINAEESLTRAADKFIERFIRVEELAEKQNINMTQCPLEELDKLWDKAKKEC